MDSRDHPHRALITQGLAEQIQERLLFPHPSAGEKLLCLIDHHQHIDLAINSPARHCRASELTKLGCQLNQACTARSQRCCHLILGTWLARGR
jgi:hypothetical protein